MDNLLIVLLFVTFIGIYFILLYFVVFKYKDEHDLVLYYDLSNDNLRDTVTINLNNNLDSNLKYYSIQHAFMTDNNFIKNKDMISFLGIRTMGNIKYNIPNLYKEEVSIKMENGDYVIGSSIYTDNGTDFKTIGIPYVEYTIFAKMGIFNRYDRIRIYLDNNNNTRKVVFYDSNFKDNEIKLY